MSKENNKTQETRNYLLGKINLQSEKEKIEERLMLDDDYFEEISLQEEELIQDYADGELSLADQMYFEKNFLISDERREKLTFARSLRSYVNERQNSDYPQTVDEKKDEQKSFFRRFLWSPIPALAVILIIILCAVFLVKNFYLPFSDTQKAVASLNKAYKLERPLESRITGFDYAPFTLSRGSGDEKVDLAERNRAEISLSDEVSKNPSAGNLHSLARVYLAKKEFGEAVKNLEKAVQFAPQNAEILSDLGTAYLERSKSFDRKDDAKSLQLKARALENFEKAIELNPDLLEACFNKAITLQLLQQPNQAREAWRDYLKLDADSPWADEARQRLKSLDTGDEQGKNAEDILQDFLTAFQNKDSEKSYEITSRNREMITGKLIPQQLAFLFLKTNDAKYSEALSFIGKLEREKSNDSYFSEIADFYQSASEEKKAKLQTAQISVRKGYEFSARGKNADALEEFQRAREIFLKTGDVREAGICDYWIGYAFNRAGKIDESSEILTESVKRNSPYKWLTSHLFTQLSTNSISKNEYSKALEYNRKALKSAEETQDLYNLQKTLSQRADIYRRIGDLNKSLEFTQKNLEINSQPEVSLRQKWRDLDGAASLFYAMSLYKTSASFEKEALALAAEKLDEKTFNYQSFINLGLIYGTQGKYEEAFAFFEKGHQTAENFSEENTIKKAKANTSLQLARVQRQAGNCSEALKNYGDSLTFYDGGDFPVNQYDAHKGRLLCYFENKNDSAFQSEMPIILKLFRDYRGKILEEQNRNSFFDNEQTVYDIAIDYAFEKGDAETAFNYSEESRARSLLDLQNSKVEVSQNDETPEIKFSANVAESLKLAQIQTEIPENVQLLQYSVLSDKVLIWLISKNEFSVVKTDVSAPDLQKKITDYVNLILRKDDAETEKTRETGEELYRILINPVEEKLDGQKQIGVIPDKILFRLPFSTLISPQTKNYFIAEHAFFISPSANIFLNSSKAAKERENDEEKLLSIGNPAFNREEFPNLPDLESATVEVNNISGFYRNEIQLTKKQATKKKINSELPAANVIHFAGHYIVNEHSPLLSGLVLAENPQDKDAPDSVLANYEILGGKLANARLIVLSACQTGGEGFYNGEGIIGASRTFLAAGVPLVVASQWEVDSNATAELMAQFHRYRKNRNLSTVESLRRAQLDMLEGENKIFRKPFYWAAFTTFGGYAEF